MNESQLIASLKAGDRNAQRHLYEHYASQMFGLCRRYVQNEQDVEDILVNGFYKTLTRIDQYAGKGSFEGWMKRIMVNEALMFLRKKKRPSSPLYVEMSDAQNLQTAATAESKIAADEILSLLDHLPDGYRTVFNLFAIEEYTHAEIADLLGISINTSKSQLRKARKMLQTLLLNNENQVA